jgi:uncharacterized membrane protein YkvA (DUF1232 family)
MTAEFNRPFTKAEMDAMRRAARDENRILSDTMALIRRVARHIPFSEDVLALYYCARDPMTETRVKLIVLAALGYFIMPVDALPDWMPLLGFTDDAAVIATAVATVKGAMTDLHRKKAREQLETL